MSSIGRLSLVAAVAGMGILNAFGSTYYASPTPVDPSTEGYCETETTAGTIADAVGKASTSAKSWDAGDTVILLDGTYDYSAATPVADATDGASYIVVKGHPYLTIKSKSGKPENAVIAGGRVADETICTDARGLLLGGSLRIQGIGISNFWTRASGGGAFIMASASVTFSNCVFSCNKSRNGGGLYVKNTASEQKIYKCTFRGNSTFTDGHDSYQANYGGGIKSMKKIDVYDCTFESNFGHACGCISFGSGGNVYDSTFVANTNGTQTINGAMLNNCGVVSNCVFRRNRVENGGGIKASTVRRCKFIRNSTGGSGGIGNSGSYYDCFFYSNRFERLNIPYAYGSCLYNATRADRCLFLSCGGTAEEQKANSSLGGAVANTHCTDCVFSNCVSTSRGGAICGGSASNCLFVANTVTGGGLASDSAVLRNCVITNNGPLVANAATFVNCLIVGNGWNRSVDYTGMIAGGTAYNCTIVNNKSTCTMYNGKLYNCILWNPDSSEYCGLNGVVSNCIFRSGSCWLSSQVPKIMGDNIEIEADEVNKIKFRRTGDHPFDIGRNSIAHGGACDHNRYFDETSVDLAGRSRLSADGGLDIGCYQYTARVGLMLLLK